MGRPAEALAALRRRPRSTVMLLALIVAVVVTFVHGLDHHRPPHGHAVSGSVSHATGSARHATRSALPAGPATRAAGLRGVVAAGLAVGVPAPDVPLPSTGGALAEALGVDVHALRTAVPEWRARGGAPPATVSLRALHEQRLYRALALASDRRADRIVAASAPDVRGEVRDVVLARRALAGIPRSPGRAPALRLRAAEPAATLRAAYDAGERRYGVPWSVLAAVNFVESAFGRVRSASEAGARGPMQFLPSTWARYGRGGDIEDARDAILGAANLLHAAGAPRNLRGALFTYDHSADYVSAVVRFARRMQVDPRAFWSFYAWQVYVRTGSGGARRVTGPGL